MQITAENFFTEFMLDPFSERISKTDQKICFIASLILGIFTLSLLHIGIAAYKWTSGKIEDRTEHQNGEEKKDSTSTEVPKKSPSPTNRRDLEAIQSEREKTLETLKKQISSPEQRVAFETLSKKIYDNASQLLAECAEEPELRQFIIESTSNELRQILSNAQGMMGNVPDAQASFDQAVCVQEISDLIRQGRSKYLPKMCDQLDKLLIRQKNINTTHSLWVNGTALHHLAKLGNPLKFVEIFAKHGIDFNKQDGWQNTALVWAVANGKNSMAFEILNYEQNLNRNCQGNSALHLAIAKGYKDRTSDGKKLTISNLQLVKKMVNKGADPNLVNRNGYTALHLACVRRDPEMIKALLCHGGNKTLKTRDGKSCRQLLELTFKEAKATIEMVTPPYLLPQEDFEAGFQACLDLLS